MSSKLLFTLTLSLILPTTTWASQPRAIEIGVEQAYIPIGFDDNDRSQITIAGNFPNSCYKIANSHVTVDEATKTVNIRQMAFLYGGICLQLIVPYTQVVDLGILKEGNYTIQDKVSGKVIGTLPVAKAQSDTADDFLYAPITDANVRVDGGKQTLFLKGTFTSNCTKLKDVRINYHKDVVVVQPIAEHTESPNCVPEKVRFQWQKELKEDLKGDQLIHVRALDGQAVNRLADFE